MHPPRNSRLAAVFALVAGLAVALLVLVPLAGLVLQPLALAGQLPSGLSPANALALSLGSLLIVGLFFGALYRRVNTQLSEHGVIVPSLTGARLFRWSEFTRASGKGVQVRLHTSGPTVTINVLCYAPPTAVVPFLTAKLAKQLFPQQGAA
jgi:hypothetical protein